MAIATSIHPCYLPARVNQIAVLMKNLLDSTQWRLDVMARSFCSQIVHVVNCSCHAWLHCKPGMTGVPLNSVSLLWVFGLQLRVKHCHGLVILGVQTVSAVGLLLAVRVEAGYLEDLRSSSHKLTACPVQR